MAGALRQTFARSRVIKILTLSYQEWFSHIHYIWRGCDINVLAGSG
jgi:hypothetical protein